MNNKLLYSLVGIFGLLLIVAFQPVWSKYVPMQEIFTKNSSKAEVIIPENINKIDFKFLRDDRNLSLENREGQWYIDDNLADKTKINLLLSDLNGMRFDEVVSENQERFDTYGASESGDKITINPNSEDQIELIVGQKATQPGSIFIKPLKLPKIFIVKSKIDQFLGYNKNDWRDKILVDWTEEEIETVTIRNRGVTLELARSESEGNPWQIKRNQETRVMGDVSKDRFFETFAPFEAGDLATDIQQRLFNSGGAKLTIELVNSDQSKRTLELVEDRTNSVWVVKVDNQEELFTITSAKIQLLLDTTFKVFE